MQTEDAERPRRGRPPTGGRDPFVGLRVPPHTLARMDAAIADEGTSRSAWIVDAIGRKLGETKR